MNKVIKVINREGKEFNVRIVSKGEKYGLNNCLTHDEDVALIEFYDTKYDHTPYGQFVSRYYADTILKHNNGLTLDMGSPAWNVSKGNMIDIHDFILDWMVSD